MGRRREQLEKLLAKKDEQVQILESRIQTYRTRVSQLQTRLLSTLDTMDQVKSLQEQELVQVERENALLKAQLNRYLAVVKAAEVERDDMQDAVLRLIEKVEVSTDYSKWPRSQIQLSSLSASISHPLPKMLHNSEGHLSYVPSILASLSLERDNERKAHARTRDLAEKRILALEVQLSRREIELERCIVGGHVHDVVAEGDKTPRQRISLSAMALPEDVLHEQIGNEEIISILDSTVARNKILESEVKTLIRRLEEARASTSQISSTSNSAARIQDPPPNHRSDQRSREPLYMDNDYQGHDVEEMRDPVFLDHPLIDHQLLRDLDRQIKELGCKVDAFAEERKNIQQTFPSTISSVQNSNLSDHDQRIRELETECERLRRSEDDLRDELDSARSDAYAREGDLLERIRELEDAQWSSRALAQIEPEPPDLLDSFGTDDGELSMELATPLMPTSAIDISGVLVLSNSNVVNQVEPLPSQARPFPPTHPRSPDPTTFAGVMIEAGGDLAHGHPYPYPETSHIASADDHDSDEYYVDPPSVPLPPSPPDMQDDDHDQNHDHNQQEEDGADDDDGAFHHEDHDDHEEEEDDPGGDSPTLSQIELETSILEGEMSAMTRQLTPPEVFVFAAELNDVGMQLGEAQHAVNDGEVALEKLEELVRDLHPP